MLPDIDHPSSYIGRKLPGLSKSISKLFGHRGFTHSIVCVAALYFGLTELKEQVPSVPALGITIGYISHLLADSLTPQGAQLLYPLQVRLFKPTTFMKKLLRR
ncbi:membrane protein [Pontibacillus halophilus JSM 076056 = DSM 19796]|uniref:Membrane protein n=1 Tax=Pontibacillus halophilus JSM 076056 = DSM 19796 TaxID=1385510 RepID=A0A0A5GP03_9BACI|nr:membrane protein [Pontibacillus halophilus JSM 076056 = DSM 19796]